MASPQTTEAPFSYVYQAKVITAGLLLPIVSIALTGLRFEARRQKRHRLGWDDWFIVLALICLIGLGVDLTIGGVEGVFGKPTPPYPSRDPAVIYTQLLPGQELIGKLQYAFWILVTLCYGFTKLSVIFFYRRLFVVKRSVFDFITQVAIVISAAWTISFLFAHIFSCGRHPEYVWGNLEELLQCPSNLAYLEAFMISDFITDVLIYIMPFPLIWGLHMPTPRKLAVSIILILGAFSLAANAARLAYQVLVSETGYAENSDRYLTLTLILYWSMVEAGVALIAINLPVLQAFAGPSKLPSFLNHIWSRISGSTVGSSRVARQEGEGSDPRAITPGSGNTEVVGHVAREKLQSDSAERFAVGQESRPVEDPVSPTDSKHFSYHAMMRNGLS